VPAAGTASSSKGDYTWSSVDSALDGRKQMQVSEGRASGAASALFARIVDSRIIAIVRLRSGAPPIQLAEALVRGGITCLEFTMTTSGSIDAIEACRARLDERALIGAGTVMTAGDVARCADAGAQFIVAPNTDMAVMDATLERGLLSFPGALTPTEIVAAWKAGAHAVKVFPVRGLGPRYLTDLRGPLPNIHLIPTGGVDAGNARDYLDAGAVAVGVGGSLVDAEAVKAGDWDVIEQRAADLVAAVSR
jgi:2-dehydro-3-deoxyphosphogluconate aldolase/(4S)-4-hydroxy-2-oxoglutarate aldolase